MSCTGIVESCKALGSVADGKQGWFKLEKFVVTFDSGIHAPSQYTLTIDFIGESQKVTVELSPNSAKELVHTLQTALSQGVKMGILEDH